VHIRPSSKTVGGYQPFTLEKAVPGLFPFKHGGPSERRGRDVPCSIVEAVAHLARISTGAFQATQFTLVAYDLTECLAASKAAWVSCMQRTPDGHTKGELYSRLTPDELRLVAKWKRAV
jgi:hypothetical protein